jgi:hypothetical protein
MAWKGRSFGFAMVELQFWEKGQMGRKMLKVKEQLFSGKVYSQEMKERRNGFRLHVNWIYIMRLCSVSTIQL